MDVKSTKKGPLKKTAAKFLFAGVLTFGMLGFTSAAFAQVPPPPQAPPPPGELLKRINPFKKNKKVTADKKHQNLDVPAPGTAPASGGPPTPPNPIEAIKKIKFPKLPPHPGT